MQEYFTGIQPITFDPEASADAMSYRYYDKNRQVMGQSMAEHLRIAVCYWHNFCWQGEDAFGNQTRLLPWNAQDPMQQAYQKADAVFEFIAKLGVPYFAFHDVDAVPEGANLQEFSDNLNKMVEYFQQKMADTGIKLLWGTANLFSHRRYLAGAATNPNPAVFAYAAAQVKHALEATHQLGGDNYVLWGGREGYDTLLNTNLKTEKDNLARFLCMVLEHKHKIGFKGQLLIEPKPCEPTKHQYDYDTETVFGFLQKYGLEKEFKVNIEGNHATLAGHSFEHEVASAIALDIFGSIDANRGDPQNGWDTDQFPNSCEVFSMIIYRLLNAGGFKQGGFNFDAKVRRQSFELADMFYGHIGGIDILAKSLLNAERMMQEGSLSRKLATKYQAWNAPLGKEIATGQHTLASLTELALNSVNKMASLEPVSGRQEQLETMVNRLLTEDVCVVDKV